MQKTIKAVLAVLTIITCSRAQAQVAYGIEPSYNFLAEGLGGQGALGLRFKYFTNDDGNFFYSSYIGLGLPKTFEGSVSAVNYNTSTGSPEYTTVSLSQKLTSFNFEVGIGKIFKGDYEDGGFLGFASFEGIYWKVKNTLGTYDHSTYYVDGSYNDEIGLSPHAKLGIGYLIRTGTLGLIPTAAFSLGATTSRDGNISGYPQYISIGLRVMFFPE